MGSRLSNGEVMRGIFIKHILEDSPAGQNGTLKTGDRIVEVREYFRWNRQTDLIVQSPYLGLNALLFDISVKGGWSRSKGCKSRTGR